MKIKSLLKNFRFLLSYCIAYVIVHGWSYAFVGIGWVFDISWMFNVGVSWITILWLPNGVVLATTIPPAILIHFLIFKEKIEFREKEVRRDRIIIKKRHL